MVVLERSDEASREKSTSEVTSEVNPPLKFYNILKVTEQAVSALGRGAK